MVGATRRGVLWQGTSGLRAPMCHWMVVGASAVLPNCAAADSGDAALPLLEDTSVELQATHDHIRSAWAYVKCNADTPREAAIGAGGCRLGCHATGHKQSLQQLQRRAAHDHAYIGHVSLFTLLLAVCNGTSSQVANATEVDLACICNSAGLIALACIHMYHGPARPAQSPA